ncbi:metallophosphoesterase [Tamlana sp. 62-3]|uniref:Metallophosphoesterase n=1 Tax=Neotamlana sargassicola TaxID=2883125 RepID=A0A9X1L408_9FLAO|nr:metallophosphoesterase [Tamlana sargassicola]MCB4807620.1 metallophosphoesterase [Tamlana sargassicola]
MNIQFKRLSIALSLILLSACATYKTQYNTDVISGSFNESDIVYSFYLIGDAGNSPIGSKSQAVQALEATLKEAPKASTVLFLGDNIYPKGMPDKDEKGREFAEHQLNVQTEIVKDFKGDAVFIPGNHDWYSNGLKGLKRQEKYIEDKLGKNTFLPEDGCPIEKVEISEDITLLVVDTEWYLVNWDKHPTINDDCDIKTRSKFLDELESEIKKARGKTTVIALHHPMFSNGPHGGKYSVKQHLKPIPVLGTLKNIVRKTSGVSPEDLQNKRYNDLKKRVVTLAQENDKVIFVSGHEHSLQYLVKDNLPQIISGAGSKSTPTRNVADEFSSSNPGYARLDVLKNGSSFVRFYSATNKVLFQTQVHKKDRSDEIFDFDSNFPDQVSASIYTQEEIDKSKLYKAIWGERYREVYGTNVEAPTVNLDTLFGGLKPFRKGGGHQSKSLHLKDKNGARYVMRALRKSALVYLQATVFLNQYIEGQFEDTAPANLIQDFFTGSHPYAPFVTATLSDPLGIYHTNPVLYYVPKQNALGLFNEDFGDELYMIEEHPSDGHDDIKSFGYAKDIVSTDDLREHLRKDEKYSVDDIGYLRARLFDMTIGDWDRHTDQWRWAEFEISDDEVVYKAVPRDRDQVFSIMGDGAFMQYGTRFIPALKLMEGFNDDIRSVKGFNFSPFGLDNMLLNKTTKQQWNEQVAFIQKHLTDEVIDEALNQFPKEVQNPETLARIKRVLKARLKNLPEIANAYFKVLNKTVVITGTDKDDFFDIERLPNGETKVSAYRNIDGKRDKQFYEKTFNKNDNKEIWIYGLDDKDVFNVFGEGNKFIKVRLIGGQNKDTYNIENGKNLKFYDYKSKESIITTNKGSKHLTNDYNTNVYDFTKPKNNTNQVVPSIGYNPDDGVKIGAVNTFTTYGFKRSPFTTQHSFSAAYFFATSGFDLGYNAEFANVVNKWNLAVDTRFTSPNYAINYFGYGNSTINPEADKNDGLDVDLDYNRVKIRKFKIAPALVWRGELGASWQLGLSYENNEVDNTAGRFVSQPNVLPNSVFNNQNFVGVNAKYQFDNVDYPTFPTMGMHMALEAGYKNNTDNSNSYAYVIPELAFDYKIIPSGQLVFATKSRAHFNIGDDFEFYQAANIGAKTGLRGYRNERFIGKTAFTQSSDIRVNLRRVRTGLLPLNIGVYGGFDVGRVWVDNDFVLSTESNSDTWNTSLGGGVFADLSQLTTLNASLFHSEDGVRFAFRLGFAF